MKLLRVLQERKGPRRRRVRAGAGRRARVLAATNRDVEQRRTAGQIPAGSLRPGSNILRVELPPLRDRPGDGQRARLSASCSLRQPSSSARADVRSLTADAVRALDGYPFPGNVRELENTMERAVALVSRPAVGLGDLPAAVSGLAARRRRSLRRPPTEGCNLDRGHRRGRAAPHPPGARAHRRCAQAAAKLWGSRSARSGTSCQKQALAPKVRTATRR